MPLISTVRPALAPDATSRSAGGLAGLSSPALDAPAALPELDDGLSSELATGLAALVEPPSGSASWPIRTPASTCVAPTAPPVSSIAVWVIALIVPTVTSLVSTSGPPWRASLAPTPPSRTPSDRSSVARSNNRTPSPGAGVVQPVMSGDPSSGEKTKSPTGMSIEPVAPIPTREPSLYTPMPSWGVTGIRSAPSASSSAWTSAGGCGSG